MRGLVPRIHVFFLSRRKTWMAGTRPAMTIKASFQRAGEGYWTPIRGAALRVAPPPIFCQTRAAI